MRKVVMAAAGACLLALTANANTITFVTPAGSSTGGGPVNAQVTFTTGAGMLDITLQNLQANPTDIAQALSDLSFTLDVSTAGSTLPLSSGQEITVNGNGTTSTGATVPAGWVLSASGSSVTLDVLSGPGHAGPAHLIIGPAGPGGVYTAANGSIAGNSAHNPFLNQSATFNLVIPTVTVDTTVIGVTFSFGTTSGINVPGVPTTSVPDGGTTALLLGGVLTGLAMLRRKLS
jgi:hypothetical protein